MRVKGRGGLQALLSTEYSIQSTAGALMSVFNPINTKGSNLRSVPGSEEHFIFQFPTASDIPHPSGIFGIPTIEHFPCFPWRALESLGVKLLQSSVMSSLKEQHILKLKKASSSS